MKTVDGSDTDRYRVVKERANLMIQTVESGGHFTNDEGRLLDSFKHP